MSDVCYHVRVTGRVQGVSFRAWTEDQARRRGLSGWVRNEADGSVTALISGPRDAVDAMIDAFHHGPTAARVDRVDTQAAASSEATGFSVSG